MIRRCVPALIVFISLVPLLAQTPVKDPAAVALAAQALSALSGTTVLTDATLQAAVTYIAGSDVQSGTATLEAATSQKSHIYLNLDGGRRQEIRNGSGAPPLGKWAGPDGAWHPMVLHNCWVDPTWFFPALTIQSALNDPQIAFSYIGDDTKGGVAVQHIRISRLVPGQTPNSTTLIQQLSQIDLYVDTASHLPVAFDFNAHPDNDAGLDLQVEVQFAGWQSVRDIKVPSRIQKFLQGSLVLDLSGITVLINSGIPQTDFTIQATAQ